MELRKVDPATVDGEAATLVACRTADYAITLPGPPGGQLGTRQVDTASRCTESLVREGGSWKVSSLPDTEELGGVEEC